MTNLIEKLQAAQSHALANRPKVGGFPYLAECLKQAGVQHNYWELPSCQSIYVMNDGTVVNQGSPLITGMAEVPVFNEEALITALRTNQAGESTFPEFLQSAWQAGIIKYHVDFSKHLVTYYGANKESYEEFYPEVEVILPETSL
jgi:uncharacterized protein YbcV (DUF1398 family)